MFDYVIIGAGSASCLLAARLSEDPSIKVALIGSSSMNAVVYIRGHRNDTMNGGLEVHRVGATPRSCHISLNRSDMLRGSVH